MKDETFLDIADCVAKESKCVSLGVGAVLVKDGRIISTGYNGTPSGYLNCDAMFVRSSFWAPLSEVDKTYTGPTAGGDVPRVLRRLYPETPFGKVTDEDRKAHSLWSMEHEIHAEMNALMFAARHGIATDGSEIFITHQPCDQCVKNMLQAGVRRILYRNEYRLKLSHSAMSMICKADVEIHKWTKAGLRLPSVEA